MHDPHGFKRLFDALQDIKARLGALGRPGDANLLEDALAHYGISTPSEFMGESRKALHTIMDSKELPAALRDEMEAIVAQITAGFRAVGGT